MTRLLAVLAVIALGLGSAAQVSYHDVTGNSGGTAGHRWEYEGKASEKAAVGKPDNRLEVKVKNGDVVRFKVVGGRHGVLFEKAKSELKAGVWEVVDATGTLKDLPPASGFDRFDRNDAQTTDAEASGNDLIEIKVKDLKAGSDHGILFACNPHSAMGNPSSTTMLGVIVLADDEEKKGK